MLNARGNLKRLKAAAYLMIATQILRAGISGFDQETRKYAASPDALLRRVRMYSKVSYIGRYKSQFTVKTKGQRLIFNALGITEEGLDSDDGKAEELLS